MTEEQKVKLCDIGVDLDETLERFVDNEDLYFRCLNKLLQDSNYQNMLDAIENANAEAAFDYAHALKGVSANLGLDKLYREMKTITEVFRAGSLAFDLDNMDRLKSSYEEACEIIKSL